MRYDRVVSPDIEPAIEPIGPNDLWANVPERFPQNSFTFVLQMSAGGVPQNMGYRKLRS